MTFEVKVPATTANIACGFDVLGMALSLFYRVRVKERNDGRFSLIHRGEGEGTVATNEDNLFFKTIHKTWDAIGHIPMGFDVEAWNEIPIARGLGSSAACIVAGVVTANLLAGNVLREEEMIRLAVEIEGHPDNILPAFLGGFTIAFPSEGKIYYRKFPFFDQVEMVLCIPSYKLSTEKMRQILPREYPRHQVVSNLAHLAYLLGSIFEKDLSGFLMALEDYVHEPYRGREVRGFFEVKNYVVRRGLGNAAISGSGPTIILFLHRPLSEEEAKDVQDIFSAYGVEGITLKRVRWMKEGIEVQML